MDLRTEKHYMRHDHMHQIKGIVNPYSNLILSIFIDYMMHYKVILSLNSYAPQKGKQITMKTRLDT